MTDRKTERFWYLADWAKDPAARTRAEAAAHEGISAALLDALIDDPSPDVRLAAVSNTKITSAQLSRSSHSPHSIIRLRTAQNKRTPAADLDRLVDDEDHYVRRWAAANTSTPMGALDRCLQSGDPDLVCSVHFSAIWPLGRAMLGWVCAGWVPSIAHRLITNGLEEAVDADAVAAWAILAELEVTPSEAFWNRHELPK